MLGTTNAIINNLLNNIFHAIWLYLLTTNPAHSKKTTGLLAALSVVIAEVLSLFTIFTYGVESKAFTLLYIVGSLVYIIFYVFFMQDKRKFIKSFFIFFSYICVWAAVYVVVMVLTNHLFKGWEPSIWILRSAFNIILLGIYYYFLKNRFSANREEIEKPSGVLILVSGLSYIMLPVLMIYYAFSTHSSLSLVFIVFLLLFCTAVYMLIFRFIKQMSRERNLKEVEQQNKILLEAVKSTEEIESIATQIRHDNRLHNQMLLSMAEAAGNTEIINYLKQTDERSDETKLQKFCANKTVNNIIFSYYKKARKKGIEMTFDINMKEETNISDVDLVAILGNMLDNAINGSENSDGEKKIELSIHHKAIKLLIVCKNTCTIDVPFENGMPKRAKGKGNGVGTKSIKMSAERYFGEARYSLENKIFTCAVMLNDDAEVPCQ